MLEKNVIFENINKLLKFENGNKWTNAKKTQKCKTKQNKNLEVQYYLNFGENEKGDKSGLPVWVCGGGIVNITTTLLSANSKGFLCPLLGNRNKKPDYICMKQDITL